MPVTRLTSAFTLGVGAVMGLACWGIASREWNVLERERIRELEDVGREVRAVATALTPELGRKRAASIASEGLEAIFAGGWRWLSFRPGELDPGDATLAALTRADIDALTMGQARRLELGAGDAERVVVITPIPALTEGDLHVAIEIGLPINDLRAVHALTVRDLGISLALAVLAVALVSAALGHLLITRPIRAATGLVERATEGEVGARLPASALGELDALLQAVNTLCERLAASVASLEEQRKAAADAEAKLRRAEHLASIGKLAAGVAHELNTPLNVALARADAIARNAEDAEEARRKARIISEQVERMSGIVRQLLDYSRPAPLHKTDVDAVALVRRCAELLAPQAKQAEVAFEIAAPEEPPGPLRADAGQIEQVFINLMMNAIQASPGGGTVEVRFAREQVRPPDARESAPRLVEALRVEVVDRGVGIPREAVDRIFEPFFTTKPAGEGTGLGLPVAWSIVRAHGGWITVESREGRGTCFSVHLPADAPEEART